MHLQTFQVHAGDPVRKNIEITFKGIVVDLAVCHSESLCKDPANVCPIYAHYE